jgi:putative peptide zinc metalloprotease protein
MSAALGIEPAENRVLGLRARRDLESRAQRFGNERYWAVKDPVSLKYYHLRDEEYAILTMLDGRTSLVEVRRQFDLAFAPRRLALDELHGFVATLHRYGLLLSDSAGQGEQLLVRQHEGQRRRLLEALLGILAIRFPGINPTRFLDAIYPKFKWLFSPACVIGGLLLALAAVMLVSVQFDAFVARLPDVHAIVAASNLPLLILALAVVKILHELGHALACRHFGGECHELGLMLLVFTPCLYCNVSDSWMLASKWRRIAVAAAGMYVELILASVCVFLWWFSAPGVFNSLCLNTILICSLGTVVLNGNPLLRYDGYYILSDLLEVPNLRLQASAAARRRFARWFLGLDLGIDRHLAPRRERMLIAYAVAATLYRCFVVVAILWALNLVARPYHLESLVVLVACVVLIGMAAPAMSGLRRWLGNPARRERLAPARVALTSALVVAAIVCAAWVPLPMRASAPMVLEYRDARRVYVTEPGRLVERVSAGQSVTKGQTIARLANPDVERELAQLTSDRDRQQLFLENLAARRLQGVDNGVRIPAAKAALADIDERLSQLRRDATELTIVAPTEGTVLPPPSVPRAPDSDKLSQWSGTPLDQRNLGSYLDTGTLVCLVGQPNQFEAVLHVAQSDVELVQPGQSVRMILDHLPGEVFDGRVTEVAKLDADVMPRELTAAGDVPSRTDARGMQHPLDTWYQARVQFDREPPYTVARVHGTAKISVAPRSLGSQWVRYLKQTFSR